MADKQDFDPAIFADDLTSMTDEELGCDHFEGRSRRGLRRHALMTMIAYAFLQNRRLEVAKWGKSRRRSERHHPSQPCRPSAASS